MINMLLAVIYLSFISLGLPDSLLGSAWPSMHLDLGVPISYSGIISMIISLGTIFSSLQSDRLTRLLGPGRITAISVAMTAAALMGFSLSGSFIGLCLLAIPYGLGAGSVDAALNNYVALHFASRHMSWLHCMWGVGASIGPYIMGQALSGASGWHGGYRIIGLMQVLLSIALFISLPLWRKGSKSESKTESFHGSIAEVEGGKTESGSESLCGSRAEEEDRTAESGEGIRGTVDIGAGALSLRQIISIPGARALFITFFSYMALEATASLWASSFLSLERGFSAVEAASCAGLFFIGITIGRALSGFMTMKLGDTDMIRLGRLLILAGLIMVLLPIPFRTLSAVGMVATGLGCAPIYPSIIHSTPALFGEERSQAIIGVQMASAYVGSCFMPPLFGFIANHAGFWLYPVFLLIIWGIMSFMHERLIRTRTL